MNSFEAIVYLLGGLALLVFGLKLMSDTCCRLFGRHLVAWLCLDTDNRLRAVCVGIPTALSLPYPSSSAALLANMGEAGLFPVRHAAGVLIGMSVGCALLIEAFAFDLGLWALVLLVLGALAFFCIGGSRLSGWGSLALAVGLTLYGLAVMKTGAIAARQAAALDVPTRLLERMSTDAFDMFLLGALLGAVLRSWPVTLAVAFAFGGGVSALVPFSLGASVGAATVGLPTGFCAAHFGRRLALANFLMRLLAASFFMLILDDYMHVVSRWSVTLGAAGEAHAAAHAALLYAVLSAAIFIPLVPVVASLVSSAAFPGIEQPVALPAIDLDDYPAILERARLQTLRAGKVALAALRRNLSTFLVDPRAGDRDIRAACLRVDLSVTAVSELLRSQSANQLSDSDLQKRNRLASVARDIASVSGIISRELAPLARDKTSLGAEFATEAAQEFERFHRFVADEFEGALERLDDSSLDVSGPIPDQPALTHREKLLSGRVYSDAATPPADAGIDRIFHSAVSSLTTIQHYTCDILSLLGATPPKHFR